MVFVSRKTEGYDLHAHELYMKKCKIYSSVNQTWMRETNKTQRERLIWTKNINSEIKSYSMT